MKFFSWTTKNELKFIRNLGTRKNFGTFASHVSDLNRLELLRLYSNSIPYRSNWDEIDKGVIIKYVEKEIRNEIKTND